MPASVDPRTRSLLIAILSLQLVAVLLLSILFLSRAGERPAAGGCPDASGEGGDGWVVRDWRSLFETNTVAVVKDWNLRSGRVEERPVPVHTSIERTTETDEVMGVVVETIVITTSVNEEDRAGLAD